MGATTTETRTGPVAGARAGFDVLLTDAAVGNGTRRFIQPRAVAQVAAGVANGDRRFADPRGSATGCCDAFVRWQSCLSDDARCVEVTGSHVGLIFNRKVYRAIADELAR